MEPPTGVPFISGQSQLHICASSPNCVQIPAHRQVSESGHMERCFTESETTGSGGLLFQHDFALARRVRSVKNALCSSQQPVYLS